MLSAEQLEMRRSGLGSSDMAGIVGKSRFVTPFDVWLSKVEKLDQETDFSRDLGHLLEGAVTTLYERKEKPWKLQLDPGTSRHKTSPIFLSTPDAIAAFDDELRPVEAKTSRFGDDWGEEGTDEIPTEYVIQSMQHLSVFRSDCRDPEVAKRCDVPVLIRTDEFRTYRVLWDPELAGVLQQEGERFWTDHVLTKNPPPMDGSRKVDGWLKKRFPADDGSLMEATEEQIELANQLKHAIGQAEHWKGREETLIAQLKLIMGEAQVLTGPFGKLTWKKNKDSPSTEWKMLADSLLSKLPEEKRLTMIAAFTKTKQGNRPFLKNWSTK